mmetsp:Transcript_34593/g.102650  ORF Transcript_34593/g.102650 Transcript_34593/m.102650 type:complete len:249 (+) Transcript_34593:451-1197(+)
MRHALLLTSDPVWSSLTSTSEPPRVMCRSFVLRQVVLLVGLTGLSAASTQPSPVAMWMSAVVRHVLALTGARSCGLSTHPIPSVPPARAVPIWMSAVARHSLELTGARCCGMSTQVSPGARWISAVARHSLALTGARGCLSPGSSDPSLLMCRSAVLRHLDEEGLAGGDCCSMEPSGWRWKSAGKRHWLSAGRLSASRGAREPSGRRCRSVGRSKPTLASSSWRGPRRAPADMLVDCRAKGPRARNTV